MRRNLSRPRIALLVSALLVARVAWAAPPASHGGIAGTGMSLRLARCERGEVEQCVVVTRVAGGSSAQRVGLHVGDIVLAITPMQGPNDVTAIEVTREPYTGASADDLDAMTAALAGPTGTHARVLFTRVDNGAMDAVSLERGRTEDGPWCVAGDCTDGTGQVQFGGFTWDGRFAGGMPEGDVTIHLWEGVYVGPAPRWMPEGEGTFTDADGTVWKGTFSSERAADGRDEAPQWEGVGTYLSGALYTGNGGGWARLDRVGWGRLVLPNGASWDGPWQGNVPRGRGTWVGFDEMERVGTYEGRLFQWSDLVPGARALFEGEVTRRFGLADPSAYHPGCGECLAKGTATATGDWVETGPYGENALPHGVHTFTGPDGAKETFDFGPDVSVHKLTVDDYARMEATLEAQREAIRRAAAQRSLTYDEIHASMERDAWIDGVLMRSVPLDFDGTTQGVLSVDHCSNDQEVLVFKVVVPSDAPALDTAFVRSVGGGPYVKMRESLAAKIGVRGWTVYGVTDWEAGSYLGGCQLTVVVRSSSGEAVHGFGLVTFERR